MRNYHQSRPTSKKQVVSAGDDVETHIFYGLNWNYCFLVFFVNSTIVLDHGEQKGAGSGDDCAI